jgi:hypothetical protein
MERGFNLYTIMEIYAKKIRSPIIDIKRLIAFLEQNAKRFARENPEWVAWAINPNAQVWESLSQLQDAPESHKIIVSEADSTVFLIDFFEKMLREAYESEETEEGPFPHEQRYKVVIPTNMIRTINLESELSAYLDEFQENELEEYPRESSRPFVKIFISKYGNALILPDLIPRRLPEKAFQKIRNFLRENNNKEYIQNKMIPAFRGKENHLRDMFTRILIRPGECLDELESAREFSYSFWAYFCNLTISITGNDDEISPADMGLLQALNILDAFNNYHKIKSGKIKTRDTALKNLALALEKPPFFFSFDGITKFTDTKGLPLLGQYSQDDLEAYLRGETTRAEDGLLPELLILRDMNGVQQFIKKSTLLPCFTQLLAEARLPVRKVIVERWFKLLKALDHEAAMDDEEAFGTLLTRTTKTISPFLIAILRDNKLPAVYREMAATVSPPPGADLFARDKLLPLADLLKLKRKEILSDVRMLLPFWYSIPILSQIIEQLIRFFRRKKVSMDERSERKEDDRSDESPRGSVLRTSINETAAVLIPKGKTLDGALTELEGRWGILQDAKAKKNLIEDVNALIRDRLRRTLRLQKSPRITPDALKRLAAAIVAESPTLQNLGGREALVFYIELYIIKLVQRSEY